MEDACERTSNSQVTGSGARDAPNCLNSASLQSVARRVEYWPAAFIDLTTRKPLVVMGAVGDRLIPIAEVRDAFARAGEPKRMVEIDCGHFDL